MRIKLTNVYVDDQEKALRFYTEVLGFVKKADFSQGPFRWLTVASPEDLLYRRAARSPLFSQMVSSRNHFPVFRRTRIT